MLSGILTGAPLWVWPLLAGLILLGLKASKDRRALCLPSYFHPLLGLLSVSAVHGLGVGGLVWLGFAVAYLVGAVLGHRFQGQKIVGKSAKHVSLKGEWLTMAVLMVIFWMNFVGGVVEATLPLAFASLWFKAGFALLAGLAAGSWAGRALRVFATPAR
ncbi:MAG: hypothetical protein COB08_012540 [Rhodobacteraceae bacterium]|nr:hypothetical protein [Paracoccaceae bacterium]